MRVVQALALATVVLACSACGTGGGGMQLTKNAAGGEFYFNADGGTHDEAPCTGMTDPYERQMCIGNSIQAKGLQLQQFQMLQNQADRAVGQMNEIQRNPVQCPLCGETYQQ
jgi:hypothetical protein